MSNPVKSACKKKTTWSHVMGRKLLRSWCQQGHTRHCKQQHTGAPSHAAPARCPPRHPAAPALDSLRAPPILTLMTLGDTDDAAQLHCMVSIYCTRDHLNIFPLPQPTHTFTKMLKLALALLATAVAVPLSHITADQGAPPIKLETSCLVVATLTPPSSRFAPHPGVPQLHGHLWPLLQLR
jgi:hypothetical protein